MSNLQFNPRRISRERYDLTTRRFEMLLTVNGVEEWREARYETGHGPEPVLHPILQDGERLIETLDKGPIAIISIIPCRTNPA